MGFVGCGGRGLALGGTGLELWAVRSGLGELWRLWVGW